MKTYTLSFADSLKHVPANPERTAKRSLGWDVQFKEWPNRTSLLKSIQMQQSRAARSDDWKLFKQEENRP